MPAAARRHAAYSIFFDGGQYSHKKNIKIDFRGNVDNKFFQ